MSKPYVFITRTLPETIVEPFRSSLDIHMWPKTEEPVERSTLLAEANKANAIITMLSDHIDEEVLENAPRLQAIANLAVGYDNIDINLAHEHGITVTNTPDVLTETTADLTFGLLMATARRLLEASDYVREDKWSNWAPLLLAGQDVHHKTIGIVGMGRIGKAVAHRAQGFHMNILYHNRSHDEEAEQQLGATYASFDELLEHSDFVVCLAPLTEQTKHMFHKASFQRMKSSAIFVNASRGANVVEEDLYEALVKGQIAGAGLDVFEEEPIRNDHPLLSLSQVVALPHIGSATIETRQDMMKLCLENIQLVLDNKQPKTKVTI